MKDKLNEGILAASRARAALLHILEFGEADPETETELQAARADVGAVAEALLLAMARLEELEAGIGVFVAEVRNKAMLPLTVLGRIPLIPSNPASEKVPAAYQAMRLILGLADDAAKLKTGDGLGELAKARARIEELEPLALAARARIEELDARHGAGARGRAMAEFVVGAPLVVPAKCGLCGGVVEWGAECPACVPTGPLKCGRCGVPTPWRGDCLVCSPPLFTTEPDQQCGRMSRVVGRCCLVAGHNGPHRPAPNA